MIQVVRTERELEKAACYVRHVSAPNSKECLTHIHITALFVLFLLSQNCSGLAELFPPSKCKNAVSQENIPASSSCQQKIMCLVVATPHKCCHLAYAWVR